MTHRPRIAAVDSPAAIEHPETCGGAPAEQLQTEFDSAIKVEYPISAANRFAFGVESPAIVAALLYTKRR